MYQHHQLQQLPAGDSYTVGFGNVGGNTSCNATVCESRRVSGLCSPELDSENAAISWGPLTAASLEADYQACIRTHMNTLVGTRMWALLSFSLEL